MFYKVGLLFLGMQNLMIKIHIYRYLTLLHCNKCISDHFTALQVIADLGENPGMVYYPSQNYR